MSPAALGLLISFRSSRPSKLTILLVHADHDSGVLGPSDNGRENSTGGIVSGESSLEKEGEVSGVSATERILAKHSQIQPSRG